MKSAVLVFPGINRERDMARALKLASGHEPAMVWHAETSLPKGTDLVVVPGGFSYGDYLRCGAIAARAPVMDAVRAFAKDGPRLADMHVRDLMTREVTTCTQETTMIEAEKLMNKHRVRHLPVMDGGKLVGMLSIRDVMVWRQQEARDEVNVLRDAMIAVRNR